MELNEIPKGQLSTIILTTLLTGDKYGYEIINEVEEKTNGEVIIKKPSLYSSLSKMENQDLVSSYWKDSEIGGKRHYYRLTDYGRKQVLQWQEDLLIAQNSLSKTISDQPKIKKPTSLTEIKDAPLDNTHNHKDVFAQQENLFDVLNNNLVQETEVSNLNATTKQTNTTDVFLQYDLFNSNFISTPAEDTPLKNETFVFNMSSFENQKEESIEQNKNIESNVIANNDALSNQLTAEEILNSRIEDKIDKTNFANSNVKVEIGDFDIEYEFNNLKKNLTSYSENAKQQTATPHNHFSDQQQFHNNQPLSTDIGIDESEESIAQTTFVDKNQNKFDTKQNKDDAVFITEELNEEDFKVKKIAPAVFHTITPKVHESQIENQSKNIQNSSELQNVTETYYENYDQLKKYFSNQNIDLKIYNQNNSSSMLSKGSAVFVNKFKFLSYLLFFILSAIELFVCYLISNHYGLLIFPDCIYHYAMLSAAVSIPLLYFLFKYIKNPNKKISVNVIAFNPIWFKLCLIVFASAIILSINVLFGMSLANLKFYISTLVLPIAILLNTIPVHIFKILLLKRHK